MYRLRTDNTFALITFRNNVQIIFTISDFEFIVQNSFQITVQLLDGLIIICIIFEFNIFCLS